jgi:leader peptidase (prepilin peptidase) / N-methyltransferase
VTAPVVVLTALVSGLVAVGLTAWIRPMLDERSGWLRTRPHAVVAVLGGAGAAALARTSAELLAYALLALACALLIVVDFAAYRLPDVIVLPMYPVLFLALSIAAVTSGDWGRLGRAALAGLSLLVLYLVLALINPSGLGLGDVKLAGLLGAFLGWLGWQQLLIGTLAAFVCSALVALALLATRRATKKTEFPFGPWMIAGTVIGAVAGAALMGAS